MEGIMKGVVIFASVLAFVLAAPVGPAGAQDRFGDVIGEILGGILGDGERASVSGHVVFVRHDTLVFRTHDQRTLEVDVRRLDPALVQRLQPGQPVRLEVRRAVREGPVEAIRAEVDPAQPPADFQRVEGTIEDARGGQVLFRTRDGFRVPVDISRIGGLDPLRPNDPATLIYEQVPPEHQVAAVWIETGTPAASPPATVPRTMAERLEGRVQAISLTSLTLQTFDGRHVQVDLGAVDARTRDTIRPGDVVTVFGHQQRPDVFAADWIETDRARRW
jgi:hypothetical protein